MTGLIYFYVCAAIALLGAIATIAARNPIRGAMGLLATILAIAGLFLALHAHFLAAIQLIVYAGAIVVLFIFVIMLLGPSATSSRDQRGQLTRVVSGALFLLVASTAMYLVIRPGWGHAARLTTTAPGYGTIDAIGQVMFTEDIGPFELSSALLIVAIVAAVAVARGRHSSDQPRLPAHKEET